jgi:alpha-glucosidase (family GH31 glycosyl hydrolase)
MNEPHNLQSPDQCENNKWNNPPFVPRGAVSGTWWSEDEQHEPMLSEQTICLDTVQSANNLKHYDVHNLYGYSESVATRQACDEANSERCFILSRSHFAGSQKYAHHWMGDNFSAWKDMKYSVVGMLDMNIAGYAFTGSDICGHVGESNEQLCNRWTQLGFLYPFSRNHNSRENYRQDPAHYASFDPSFGNMAKKFAAMKYQFSPSLYTLLEEHTRLGKPVVRPLFFDFDGHENMELYDVDDQFLWGKSLMFAPVMTPSNYDNDQTMIQIFFPAVFQPY